MTEAVEAVFHINGNLVEPTVAARGPWSPKALHGGGTSAMLAGLLETEEDMLVRVLVEILRPIPCKPLRLSPISVDDGKRVRRASITLLHGETPVARAYGLRMRQTELDLPEAALSQPASPFDASELPDLTQPNEKARQNIGHDAFDSLAVGFKARANPNPGPNTLVWTSLLLPLIHGRPNSGVQLAVVVSDFGSTSTNRKLPFTEWSFMNTDITVALARPPQGPWVGAACDSLLQPAGAGVNVSALYDEGGRVGQAVQTLFVEPRT